MGPSNLYSRPPTATRSIKIAELRRYKFVQAIPAGLLNKLDKIERELATVNSSSRSKLQKIYGLMAALSDVARPYVACGNNCSACCKMNVTILKIEAENIEIVTGIQSAKLKKAIIHSPEEFLGTSCPFLDGDACSIYEDRPFVCRWHISFDTSNYWCDPSRTQEMTFPAVHFLSLENAVKELSGDKLELVSADIRDFFKDNMK